MSTLYQRHLTVIEPATTETIAGWPVAFVAGEPLIEDEELGRRLGYAEPRQVRELIARLFSDSEVIRTVRQTRGGGRPARVYMLTKWQAIKVCMRSEMPAADRIQDEVIA